MAIEKIEGKKSVELTKPALIQLISAGALALLALLFGWLAYSNWSFKTSLVEGYRLYEGNQAALARNSLKAAAHVKSEHQGSREVLAKIYCDAGGPDLEEAKKLYEELRRLGDDSTAVKVGLGVVYLKQADQAKSPKEVSQLVGNAVAEFQKAGGIHGEIGLGHCDLLLAHRQNDPKYLASAKKRFEGIRSKMSSAIARTITRDQELDFYSGLGVSLASSNRDQDLSDARDAFLACALLSRNWELPRADMMLTEARRWAIWNGNPTQINAVITEIDQRRKVLVSYWRDGRNSRDLQPLLARPWMLWSLSFAQALSRAKNDKDASRILGELKSMRQLEEHPEPWLADAKHHCEMAVREGLTRGERDSAVKDALAPLDMLLKRYLASPADEAAKDKKARVLNDLGVMRFLQGMGNHQYKLALDSFQEALKLYPDDYMYNRNLVLALKRSKVASATIQAPLDKAKAAATGEFADDFDKLQRVLEEK